jgi:hypothetical protein
VKSTLEVNGIPATFEPETMAVHANSIPVEPGAQVELCSWCDPKKFLTQSLHLAGYKVSHGICDPCRSKHFSV